MMKVLVLHNSDEVLEVFIGENLEEIFEKCMKHSEYVPLETERLNVDEITFDIFKDTVIHLYHDGDSEHGYTLKDLI